METKMTSREIDSIFIESDLYLTSIETVVTFIQTFT